MFLEFISLICSIISNYSIIEIISLLVMGLIASLGLFCTSSQATWKRKIINAAVFAPYMTLSLCWVIFSLNKPWFVSLIPVLPIFLIIFVKWLFKKQVKEVRE